MDSQSAMIAATTGAVISLLFNYIPGLNTKFDTLSADMQRTVMGILILLTAIGMALWQCSGETVISTYCPSGTIDWRMVLTNAVFALVGNQSADRISPKPKEEKPNIQVARTSKDTPRSYPPRANL